MTILQPFHVTNSTFRPPTPRNKGIDRIKLAREVLKPSRVRLHRSPFWFRQALREALWSPNRPIGRHGEVLIHQVLGPLGWLDHWGLSKLDSGTEVFVSEPYSVDENEILSIAAVASAIDCRWWLSANSWWNPGATIRIVFAEKKTP